MSPRRSGFSPPRAANPLPRESTSSCLESDSLCSLDLLGTPVSSATAPAGMQKADLKTTWCLKDLHSRMQARKSESHREVQVPKSPQNSPAAGLPRLQDLSIVSSRRILGLQNMEGWEICGSTGVCSIQSVGVGWLSGGRGGVSVCEQNSKGGFR